MRSKFGQINETTVWQESEEGCNRRPKGIHRKASQRHRKRRFQDMQTLYRITMYRRIHQVSIQRLAMRWTPTGKRNRGRPTETWIRLAQESCGHKIHIFSRLLHSHPSHRTPLYWDVYRHKNKLTINRKGLRNCVEFQFILVWVWEGRKFAHLNNFNISQKIIHSIIEFIANYLVFLQHLLIT